MVVSGFFDASSTRPNSIASYFNNYERPPLGSTLFGSFLVITFILDWIFPELGLFSSWILYDRAIVNFEVYRLVTYTWVHLSVIHILLNVFILMSLLPKFERQFGTIRTSLTLICLSIAPALIYCGLSLLFFPHTLVGGASGIVFSLWGYYSYRDSLTTPTLQFSENFAIPMWASPVFTLLITALLVPDSSFVGHFLGLIAGWGLVLGYFEFILEPSSNFIVKLETKADFLIRLFPPGCTYVKEIHARDNRPILGSFTSETGHILGENRSISDILPFFRDRSFRLPQFISNRGNYQRVESPSQSQNANIDHIPGGFGYDTIEQDRDTPRSINEAAFQGSGHSLA